jgi:hypothetical protein
MSSTFLELVLIIAWSGGPLDKADLPWL